MRRRIPTAVATLLVCACPTIPSGALAAEVSTVRLSFHPDRLDSSINITATTLFQAVGGGVPSAVRRLVAYLPAGLKLDLKNTSSCTAQTLELRSPASCPANSRIGFGGGVALVQLGKEIVHEPFTLDLFLGPQRGGHHIVLGYLDASSPASVQLVVSAEQFRSPNPYGIGFSFQIPPIPTLPGAPNAAIESAFLTVGEKNVAYFATVHGKRTLRHLKGIVTPKRCPAGGFDYKALVSFEDGTSLVDAGTIPCPGR
jgi:hypothetical protein